MKKGLTAILFCFCIHYASAQIDTAAREYVEPSDSTAIGKPDGNLSSKLIGIAGGKIVSDDGRVELIFPAGALTANTTISIQPTTNLAPHGTGKSYELEPSGTKFKKPVQFIFHYNDEEAKTCHPMLMGFAMQDHKGRWTTMDYKEWDSTGKSMKGFIHHFSGLSNINHLYLFVRNTPVMATKTTLVQLLDKSRTHIVDDTMLLVGYGKLHLKDKIEWFVNGIRNGNDKVGRIKPLVMRVEGKNYKITDAEYTAPDVMPVENPVTITAAVYMYTGSNKRIINVSSYRVRIMDQYKVTLVYSVEMRVAMGNEVTDSATCTFFFYPNPDKLYIWNIDNYPPSLSKEGGSMAGCKLNIDASGTGPVHLLDAYKGFKVSKEYPREVSFEFLPTFSRLWFNFWWQCKRARVNTPKTAFHEVPITPIINFLANGKEQIINMDNNGQKYKLIIKPFRE